MNKKNESKAQARNDAPDYDAQLHLLQIELVKLQRHFIGCGDRILLLLEGRDAAGKDGTIKRIVEHLSPRETRFIALGKPSDREQGQWYFQRYVPLLPTRGEFALFNRSWYNRAGVERVMGFCTAEEYEEFMQTVPAFEQMLVRSGVKLLKYYLDISRKEQARRLEDRRSNPLKQWKLSPIDEVAQKKWKAYGKARDAMLRHTHHAAAPWAVVRADDKEQARLNLMRHVLRRLHYPDKNPELLAVDEAVVLDWAVDAAPPALA
ncbi:polyphosphate kinase 2 [Roseateles saccharophilus]|uniref:ADP/GDP-polyphosphate phosphotransferase n=1 Tax=Roseateles saccharophilus TaxID=304 RepID=A0A4R3UVJ1_ROSSA|nr:polyphosphate kinase 2 [Roseateles saccharophilus]MDG0833160.1 polyphosphate kinase 2 [Roseateles saccharophilus]TCU94628.1 polyphosphate kinase 2 [Roseateles saccharophilus]